MLSITAVIFFYVSEFCRNGSIVFVNVSGDELPSWDASGSTCATTDPPRVWHAVPATAASHPSLYIHAWDGIGTLTSFIPV